MNKNHIIGEPERMRMRKFLKSNTYPEVPGVYVAVMNAEVGVHYPGRSPRLPERVTAVARRREDGGEVSRGHSRRLDPAKGPNMERKEGGSLFR